MTITTTETMTDADALVALRQDELVKAARRLRPLREIRAAITALHRAEIARVDPARAARM
jgi:hypothetical protein